MKNEHKHPLEWKFQWGGHLKQKCPPWYGEGWGYEYFLELHILRMVIIPQSHFHFLCNKFLLGVVFTL